MNRLHQHGTARSCGIVITFIIAAITALTPALGTAQPLPWAEARAQVVALAQAGKIAGIEAMVQSAQEAFERNPADDHRIAGLLDGIADKRLPFYHIESQLNQWVEHAPQSYAARLLRGQYLGVAAGRARGGAWARSTSDEQFANMRDLHERSRVDLLAATALTPAPLHARVRLMWNSLVGSQRVLFREQYELALAHSPGNIKLRRVWMASLEPRWGGTYAAMARYAAESESAVTPAQAAELKAAATSDEASMLESSNKYDAAEKKFSVAIRIADDAGHHASRAGPLARLGRAQEALEELQFAFKDPNFYRTHAADEVAQLARHQPPLAGVDELIDAVLERHPDHADLLNLRGFRLQQRGEQARAYHNFRAAGETGDAWAETMVGKYIFSGFGGVTANREEGLTWLKRAAAKGEPNAQLSVAQALEAMGRRSEIAAAQAEFQQANQKVAEKKKTGAAREALVDPQQFLWRQAVALWNEYYLYVALYLAVLAGVMLVLVRRDK
ncbi:MAG: DUF4034 domain-containing protein [Burkholderiales bacterium]